MFPISLNLQQSVNSVYVLQSHGSHTQPHLSGNNVLNDVISLYFDRMESVEKPSKQVRFDEVISLLNSCLANPVLFSKV